VGIVRKHDRTPTTLTIPQAPMKLPQPLTEAPEVSFDLTAHHCENSPCL
jgi:hypothetical protein